MFFFSVGEESRNKQGVFESEEGKVGSVLCRYVAVLPNGKNIIVEEVFRKACVTVSPVQGSGAVLYLYRKSFNLYRTCKYKCN
jgi:hypothetical protein